MIAIDTPACIATRRRAAGNGAGSTTMTGASPGRARAASVFPPAGSMAVRRLPSVASTRWASQFRCTDEATAQS